MSLVESYAAATTERKDHADFLCTKAGPAGEKVKDPDAFDFSEDEIVGPTVSNITPGVQRESRYVDVTWERNGTAETWRLSVLVGGEGIYTGETCLYAISGPST